MKTQNRTVKITLWASAICFVIAVICFLLSSRHTSEGINFFSLMYDLSLAVFGSALVGFIVSKISYNIERETTTDRFLKEADKVLERIGSLCYFDFPFPYTLFQQCIVAPDSTLDKDRAKEYAEQLKLKDFKVEGDWTTPRKFMCEWIKEYDLTYYSLTKISDVSKETPDLLFEHMLADWFSQIEGAVERYSKVSDLSIELFSSIHNQLSFIEDNKERDEAIAALYKGIITVHNWCTVVARYKPLITGLNPSNTILKDRASVEMAARTIGHFQKNLFTNNPDDSFGRVWATKHLELLGYYDTINQIVNDAAVIKRDALVAGFKVDRVQLYEDLKQHSEKS